MLLQKELLQLVYLTAYRGGLAKSNGEEYSYTADGTLKAAHGVDAKIAYRYVLNGTRRKGNTQSNCKAKYGFRVYFSCDDA
jgi:hypothetical protein